MELRHVLVEGEGRGRVGAAVVEELEPEDASAKRDWAVRYAAGFFHVAADEGSGGEGDEEAGGGEFFAEAEHRVDVALAGEADEEDMGERIHGSHFSYVFWEFG